MLPVLVSVPHGGLNVPEYLRENCLLTASDILMDSDEGAGAIYSQLQPDVRSYLAAETARAFVDLNRPPDDFTPDGVVKTETCWQVPIYRRPLTNRQVERLPNIEPGVGQAVHALDLVERCPMAYGQPI